MRLSLSETDKLVRWVYLLKTVVQWVYLLDQVGLGMS